MRHHATPLAFLAVLPRALDAPLAHIAMLVPFPIPGRAILALFAVLIRLHDPPIAPLAVFVSVVFAKFEEIQRRICEDPNGRGQVLALFVVDRVIAVLDLVLDHFHPFQSPVDPGRIGLVLNDGFHEIRQEEHHLQIILFQVVPLFVIVRNGLHRLRHRLDSTSERWVADDDQFLAFVQGHEVFEGVFALVKEEMVVEEVVPTEVHGRAEVVLEKITSQI